jgi:hypothetical protein
MRTNQHKLLFKILFKINDAKQENKTIVSLPYILPKPVVTELDKLGYSVTKFISRSSGSNCSRITWGY